MTDQVIRVAAGSAPVPRLLSKMEAAIAVSYPLVEKSPKPLLVGWIDHQEEHYGQLVSNYRSLGILPPVSRKPASQ